MELNLLFKCIVGSTAYGTNTEKSDTDIKGVYIQSNEDVLGLNYKDFVKVTADEEYFEIRNYIHLLSKANPSVLEMLFVDDKFVLYCHPSFQILRDNRYLFLTKQCKNSFVGMAVQQLHKAKGTDKMMNWEKSQMVRKEPIDFCTVWTKNKPKTLKEAVLAFFNKYVLLNFSVNSKAVSLTDYLTENNLDINKCGLSKIDGMKDCYQLFHSTVHQYEGIQREGSNHVILSSIPKGEAGLCLLLYNMDAYSAHCKKYKEYTEWLANRNTSRYVDTLAHGQQVDGKNISHAVRLVETAFDIVNKKDLIVYRPNREYLLDIRHGKFNLETLITDTTLQLKELDAAFDNSDLPEEVTKEIKHNLIIEIRKNYWSNNDDTVLLEY